MGALVSVYSFKVSGGTTALAASTKYPKIYFLVLDIFQAEFQFLLHLMLPIIVVAFLSFHGNLLQLEYHLYISIASHLEGVRL